MSTDENTPQHGAWFSMPFPINVDNLFMFKDQCAQSSGALRTADGDTVRASSIVGQQEALCVDSCQYDLQVASDVCEEISNDLKELTNAVSELAWAMKSVRDTYQGIAQEGQDCGLLVNGDTVSLYDESDDYLVSKFNELQAQAEVQRLNYERAEHVFSLALDSLKVDTYEQSIEPVFNALKDQFVLDDEHPYANALPYGMGLIWACAQVVDGLFMRLLPGPLGVVRIRWGICRPGWCGCGGGCRSLRSRWRPRCRPGRGW